MAEKIIEQNVVDAYKTNMQTYAIALNRQQAVPEVRDGMKTVLRRIIDMMFEKRYSHNKGYVKCAKVVGDVMGARHPHGDCLRGNTIIRGLNGEDYKIEDLYNTRMRYLDIMSIDINTGRVVQATAHSFRIGQYSKEIYHIELCNGAEIICTGNHPIMMYDGKYLDAKYIQKFVLAF